MVQYKAIVSIHQNGKFVSSFIHKPEITLLLTVLIHLFPERVKTQRT